MTLIQMLSAGLLAVWFATTGMSQGAPWQPTRLPPFGFDAVVAAKIYPNETGGILLGLITFERKLQEYVVEVPFTEQIQKQVVDPATGEKKVETYQVQKNVSETRTRVVFVKHRFEVPIEHAKFWSFAGESLSNDQARAILAEPRRCFLNKREGFAGDPFFSEMLKEDVLVIWFDQEKSREITDESR